MNNIALKSIVIVLFLYMIGQNFVLAADSSSAVIHLSQDEFMQKIAADTSNKEVAVIDVRTTHEFNQGHIAGAVNLPHFEIMNNISLLDEYQEKDMVFYCHTGARVKELTDYLQEIGYGGGKLYHLKGDIRAWRARHLPLQK